MVRAKVVIILRMSASISKIQDIPFGICTAADSNAAWHLTFELEIAFCNIVNDIFNHHIVSVL
jgi:hypothetical protein